MTTASERIEAIESRLAAADTAEWDTFTYIGEHAESHLLVVEGRRTVATVEPGDRAAAVLEFLGAAPADIAWLIAEHSRTEVLWSNRSLTQQPALFDLEVQP